MNQLSRFRHLPTAERRLLVQAAVLLAAIRLGSGVPDLRPGWDARSGARKGLDGPARSQSSRGGRHRPTAGPQRCSAQASNTR